MPGLSQLLQDPAPEVRIEVIQALSHFEHPQMLDFVPQRREAGPLARRACPRPRDRAARWPAAHQTTLAGRGAALKQAALAAKSGAGEPKLNALLVATRNNGASDLHLAVGQPPVIRLAADLVRAAGRALHAPSRPRR